MANNVSKPRWLPCPVLAVLLLTACSRSAVLQNTPYEPEPASVVRNGDTWTLQNRVLIADVSYSNGSVRLARLQNRQAGADYLSDGTSRPLFRYETGVDGILPKLRWLDEHKSYLAEDISLYPDGFHYSFRSLCAGAALKSQGFPVNLSAHPDRCAAFWIQEAIPDRPQVLYADHRIADYSERTEGASLKVQAQGAPNARAQIVVYKPGANNVENRTFPLDSEGRATVVFDATTIKKSKIDKTPSVFYRPER